eukprot:scaffold244342_cov26-Tisochrysis_lutea.AAC.3
MAAGSESAPAMIERIGPIGDVAHEPAAREAAASLVQQPEPLFYGELHVHRRVLLLSCWSQKFAVIADGKLRLYASRTANQPEATYQLSVGTACHLLPLAIAVCGVALLPTPSYY